ncbi:hypothetical protein [Flavobacterium sp.]
MNKIVFAFILVSNVLLAQNKKFTGVIKDATTLQPIEYVNIYFEDATNTNATGAISNELGEFSFSNTNAQVIFNHINYDALAMTLNDKENEILLQPKNYILDELIISKTSPRDYLKGIIKNSNSKIEKNTLLKSYCREIVKINKDYTKFSDALVDYYVMKGNGKSNIILTESRALKGQQIDSTSSSSIDNLNSAFNVKDYVKNAYNFQVIEKLLKEKEYDFERKLKREANGEEYEYVEIIPNVDSDKMLNKGYIIIDQKTNSIIEFKIYTAESHLKNARLINLLVAKAKITHAMNWSKFKIINNQYILTYNKIQVGLYVKMGKKIDDEFDFSSDLFVYDFKSNVEIPEKGYNKKTIFEAGTHYKQEFWKKYNSFPLTESEQKFINSVKQK